MTNINNHNTSNNIFCPFCGKSINRNSKYCLYCGRKIPNIHKNNTPRINNKQQLIKSKVQKAHNEENEVRIVSFGISFVVCFLFQLGFIKGLFISFVIMIICGGYMEMKDPDYDKYNK